jgi:hypothetical protein
MWPRIPKKEIDASAQKKGSKNPKEREASKDNKRRREDRKKREGERQG